VLAAPRSAAGKVPIAGHLTPSLICSKPKVM
jgi:hypothetical protein